MTKRKFKYKLLKKKHSPKGVLSSVLAGVSLLLFFAAVFCSLVFHGNGGLYLGAMGLIAIALSVYGFLLGLKSFGDKERDLFYCKVGALGNGVLMVIWLALFLAGIA